MSFQPNADHLAAFEVITREAAEERGSLLRTLAQLQASTSALPTAGPAHYAPVSDSYGYGQGGYPGINAYLLSER